MLEDSFHFLFQKCSKHSALIIRGSLILPHQFFEILLVVSTHKRPVLIPPLCCSARLVLGGTGSCNLCAVALAQAQEALAPASFLTPPPCPQPLHPSTKTLCSSCPLYKRGLGGFSRMSCLFPRPQSPHFPPRFSRPNKTLTESHNPLSHNQFPLRIYYRGLASFGNSAYVQTAQPTDAPGKRKGFATNDLSARVA